MDFVNSIITWWPAILAVIGVIASWVDNKSQINSLQKDVASLMATDKEIGKTIADLQTSNYTLDQRISEEISKLRVDVTQVKTNVDWIKDTMGDIKASIAKR